ncbi:ABC transporter ATP-binding protein [Clostridium paraputrificum]|uniref:ABC transporter ATP-binding protein n=1 Tax=Clostridium TaxID=1485 RepID=UPI003D324F3C
MSYLSLRNIKKNFGKVEVLRDINIEIEKGEFICFLGPSGCGKTTLLRIVAGLEKLDDGNVYLEGKDISKLSPSERNIGIVFQNYALFPNLSVFDNIAFGLVNEKASKSSIEEKVMEMLKLINLEEIKDKYPSQISGGQQQRVALARSLILNPDILLLDEPLSALDAKVRESLRTEIKRIQRKLNITTIMVTHDQEEALTMADNIILFNNGFIEQQGKPEEIYYEPNTEFVADFIGKINFVNDTNGEISFIRPECMEFSEDPMEDSIEVTIKHIEFRGNIYRVLVEDMDNNELCLDISWKDKNNMNIVVGKKLYVRI